MGKLKDLVSRAGRWLGLGAAAAPALHTATIEADRFDEIEWREVHDQAPALRDLIDDLLDRYDYTGDLIRDMWTAAYKAAPELRPREQMEPSRLVNHQVMEAMLDAPEFAELRKETAGDSYAAAMAVLAQAEPLRRMLERTKEARQATQHAAEAAEQAAQAAAAVQAALQEAAEQEDAKGEVPATAAATVQQAIDAAEAAEQEAEQAAAQAQAALDHSGPSTRTAVRAAAAQAAEQAREETALMTAWGIEPGQTARMDFETRRQLAERLRGGRLGQFAQLIGRFRQMARGERARKVEHAVGELVGVTLGDDISRAIPSEVASLGVPALRPVFAAKVAEGRLMTYETRGEQITGQGAIIALIDTSSSMTNTYEATGITREAWAKAAGLALLDQARASRRDFAGIVFSHENAPPKVFEFPGGRASVEQLLEFGETFLGGGTSFTRPLDEAAELLERAYNAEGTARADIVMVTDGEAKVSEEWMRTWQERKARLDFRTFGLAIATTPGPVLEALADNVRMVADLADVTQVADLFRVI